MRSRRQPSPRRAYLLLQLIMLIPLLAFLLGLITYGLRAQIQAHRRVSEQANRQVVMRAVLNQLRADLVQAERLEFEVLDGDEANPVPSGEAFPAWLRRLLKHPGELPEWGLRIDLPDGLVRYRLYDQRQPSNDAGAAREWSFPQVCRREDSLGDIREWRLCGQTLACRPSEYAPGRAVVVRFASRLAAGAGLESYDVFETTLLVGGGHDAAER